MDLNELRSELDKLDDGLLELFLRRMELVRLVADYKRGRGVATLQPGREEEILSRVEKNTPPEMAGYSRDFFEAVLAASRQLQDELRG